MRVGIFDEFDTYNRNAVDKYNDILSIICKGDELGYDYFATTEAYSAYSWSSSSFPLAIYSKAAAITKQIRFMTGISILPLHHPLQLASELAMADQLTGGRLEVGTGRGHPWEYPKFGLNVQESRERYDEALTHLAKLLQGQEVTAQGRFWSLENAQLSLPSVQQKLPLYVSTLGETSAAKVAQLGLPAIVPSYAGFPVAAMKHLSQVYHANYRGENPAKLIGGFLVYVDVDRKSAYRKAVPAVERVWGTFLDLYNTLPESWYEENYKDYIQASKGWAMAKDPDFVANAFPQFPVIIGDPSEVREKMLQLVEEIKPSELILMVSFGQLPMEDVHRSMDLFAATVLPELKGK